MKKLVVALLIFGFGALLGNPVNFFGNAQVSPEIAVEFEASDDPLSCEEEKRPQTLIDEEEEEKQILAGPAGIQGFLFFERLIHHHEDFYKLNPPGITLPPPESV